MVLVLPDELLLAELEPTARGLDESVLESIVMLLEPEVAAAKLLKLGEEAVELTLRLVLARSVFELPALDDRVTLVISDRAVVPVFVESEPTVLLLDKLSTVLEPPDVRVLSEVQLEDPELVSLDKDVILLVL